MKNNLGKLCLAFLFFAGCSEPRPRTELGKEFPFPVVKLNDVNVEGGVEVNYDLFFKEPNPKDKDGVNEISVCKIKNNNLFDVNIEVIYSTINENGTTKPIAFLKMEPLRELYIRDIDNRYIFKIYKEDEQIGLVNINNAYKTRKQAVKAEFEFP